MNLEKQLNECEILYRRDNFKKLTKKCDEILDEFPDNQIAIGYKGISQLFLGNPDEALKTLERGSQIYPQNYYLKNNLSMVYYDLGEYEKSLECCNEGLEIERFEWLYENKIKALIKLDRIDEAIECYEDSGIYIEITDLLIEAGKYREAVKYCIDEDLDDFSQIIDKIKEKDTGAAGPYYMSWIDKIKFRHDTERCPECGGKILPILWGYPSQEDLERSDRGEIVLGGCVIPINNGNYHCLSCHKEFYLGYKGLEIEFDSSRLDEYAEYKIDELSDELRNKTTLFVRSLNGLKEDLKGFDDEEFDRFINHLIDIDYLTVPREGFIRLVGFDDLKVMKEYLDDGKYAAPRWLVYPQLSAGTIGWRMGAGENYAMNEPRHTEEFKKLFPKPRYWQADLSKSPYRPYPPIGFFWNENGKPKYPNVDGGVEVNDFITVDDEDSFSCDTFTFNSIRQAVEMSKRLYFEKYYEDDLDDESKEEIWNVYKYAVLLNAGYFKIIMDDDLKQKLLKTGDEPLVYICDDEQNLFGRALMEIRDELRRLYENEDLIDWGYTEYLKYKPWM